MAMEEQEYPLLETLAEMTGNTYERSGLDARTFMMVRIAALVAVDAPPLSYLTNLALAQDTGLTADDVQATLVAVAPVVGGPRVVSSAGNIARALGITIRIAEDEEQAALADGEME